MWTTTERAWRCNAMDRSWQQNYKWSGLEPINLCQDMLQLEYLEGNEEVNMSEEHTWSTTESQHLDAWHNRGHTWTDFKELERWAFVPLFLFLLLPCLDPWGNRSRRGWREVEQESKEIDHTNPSLLVSRVPDQDWTQMTGEPFNWIQGWSLYFKQTEFFYTCKWDYSDT